MTQTDLRPDCSRCAALCCVLLAFDASPAFAFGKPACTRCRNLASDNSCNIHADLTEEGLSGCVAFDCHGAGPRVTQHVFGGQTWRQRPDLLPAMADAFRVMRQLHTALVLLREAARLPLTPEKEHTRLALLTTLDCADDLTQTDLADLEAGPHLKAVRAFFASLRKVEGIRLPHP